LRSLFDRGCDDGIRLALTVKQLSCLQTSGLNRLWQRRRFKRRRGLMDINVTMRELINAQKAGAIGKAQELALAILGWINHGGFAPRGFTIGQARRTAQINLRGIAMHP